MGRKEYTGYQDEGVGHRWPESFYGLRGQHPSGNERHFESPGRRDAAHGLRKHPYRKEAQPFSDLLTHRAPSGLHLISFQIFGKGEKAAGIQ